MIGKFGETVRKLQNKYDCQIFIPRCKDQSVDERFIELSGNERGVKEASVEIRRLVKSAMETNEHLLQCPCYSQWRTSFFSELDSFFIKSNTHQALSRPLLKLVKSYCSGTLGQSTMKDHGMFSVQTSIGWKNFFRGHIAKVFQEFYELTDSHQDYWTFKLL